MPKYKCSKCGAEAVSKCAVHCNVLIVDPVTADLLSWLIKINIKRKTSNEVGITFALRRWAAEDSTQVEIAQSAIGFIHSLSAEDIAVLVCGEHDWQLDGDKECSLGCCHAQ